MIRVDLSVLVFICLGLAIGPVMFLWLFNEYRRQKRERAAFRYVLRCGMCGFEFEDRTDTLLPRCPRCASLTERYKISGL
jgi:rubrerythrin